MNWSDHPQYGRDYLEVSGSGFTVHHDFGYDPYVRLNMVSMKGSPISVSGQEGKRSPTASCFFFSKRSFRAESDEARGVVRACHFCFDSDAFPSPFGKVIRSVTHLVPAWPVWPG
jgi:hypothetical protein